MVVCMIVIVMVVEEVCRFFIVGSRDDLVGCGLIWEVIVLVVVWIMWVFICLVFEMIIFSFRFG